MRYIFFDTECASDKYKAICEFGYVITDEAFNILTEDNILINPNLRGDQYDWYAVKKILTYDLKEYKKQPTYDEFYDQIKNLFLSCDMIIGHSLDGDVARIMSENKRYKKDQYAFTFYDLRDFYTDYAKKDHQVGVENILIELGIPFDGTMHKAMDDAVNTMIACKTISQKENKELKALMDSYPNSIFTYDYNTFYSNAYIYDNRMKKHQLEYNAYLKTLKRNKELNNREILNKNFCFSSNYEEKHLGQMMKFAEIIYANGGHIISKIGSADYFIRYDIKKEDGNLRKCSKLEELEENNNNHVKILTIEELLQLLDISIEAYNSIKGYLCHHYIYTIE